MSYLAESLMGGRADVLTLLQIPTTGLSRNGRLIGSLGWTSEFSYPKNALALRKQLKREQYDVVMGIGLYPNLLVWCATRAMMPRPRLLLSEITRPQAAWAGTRGRPKKELVRYLARKAYPSADAIAANSIDGVEECIRCFGVDRRRTVRIPNIIDRCRVRARAHEPLRVAWPNHMATLVVISRLERMKRVDTVIRSLAALDPALDCALLVVGDGPARRDLQQLTVELGVAERVRFYGWQENPLPWLARASALVLCSDYEGFSNAVLEAMFLDVPVVTSYCSSDARDMCRRGAAIGFEPGDVPGVTRALSHVLSSPEQRSQMVRGAAQYRSPHEISTAIPLYEKLICAIAGGAELPPELTQFDLERVRSLQNAAICSLPSPAVLRPTN